MGVARVKARARDGLWPGLGLAQVADAQLGGARLRVRVRVRVRIRVGVRFRVRLGVEVGVARGRGRGTPHHAAHVQGQG